MTTYKIEIQELLSRVIEIEAPSSEEAIDKVREMYRAEEIVLDWSDYVDTKIIDLENLWKEKMEALFNEDNSIMVKEETVLIWGLDIQPFEVEITEEIKNYIIENDIPIGEPCELVEDDVTGLYKLCIKTENDIDANK